LVADARRLPFSDREFNYCISITALCFIPEERLALREMARVARRGVALGLLNRWSALYMQKGRHGGQVAYQGARWHTHLQVQTLLQSLPMPVRRLRSAVYLPSGGTLARCVEALTPRRIPLGGFIAAVARDQPGSHAVPQIREPADQSRVVA
jgi:ubiquinone/menaquinone biosynthesis C-methylase UbiE